MTKTLPTHNVLLVSYTFYLYSVLRMHIYLFALFCIHCIRHDMISTVSRSNTAASCAYGRTIFMCKCWTLFEITSLEYALERGCAHRAPLKKVFIRRHTYRLESPYATLCCLLRIKFSLRLNQIHITYDYVHINVEPVGSIPNSFQFLHNKLSHAKWRRRRRGAWNKRERRQVRIVYVKCFAYEFIINCIAFIHKSSDRLHPSRTWSSFACKMHFRT